MTLEHTRHFECFIAHLRAGEPDATREYIRSYGPVVRLACWVRLRADGLSNEVELKLLSEAVLECFLFRHRVGQFDIESPADLLRHLFRATNGLILRLASLEVPSSLPGDSEWAQRLLAQSLLMGEVAAIIELRRQGHSWPHVAHRTGRTPEGCWRLLRRVLYLVASLQGPGEVDPDEPAPRLRPATPC